MLVLFITVMSLAHTKLAAQCLSERLHGTQFVTCVSLSLLFSPQTANTKQQAIIRSR